MNYIAVSTAVSAGRHTALIHTGAGVYSPNHISAYKCHTVFHYAATQYQSQTATPYQSQTATPYQSQTATVNIYAAAVANLARCRLLRPTHRDTYAAAASAPITPTSVVITLHTPRDLSLIIDIIRRTVAGMTITMTDGKPTAQFTEIVTPQRKKPNHITPTGRITLDTVGTVVCTSHPTLIHKFTHAHQHNFDSASIS
jgi:hypothetical protein